jgi:hypothetical protein
MFNYVSISGRINGNDQSVVKKLSEYLLPRIGAKIQM